MFYYWFSIGLTGPSKSFDGHQQKESQKDTRGPHQTRILFSKELSVPAACEATRQTGLLENGLNRGDPEIYSGATVFAAARRYSTRPGAPDTQSVFKVLHK